MVDGETDTCHQPKNQKNQNQNEMMMKEEEENCRKGFDENLLFQLSSHQEISG